MREILFRGKTLTGMWVEGAYYKQEEFYGDKKDAHIIITSKETLNNNFALESHIVIHETLGQYTGLTDKNGKKIFEGDIVKGTFFGFPFTVEDYVFSIVWQEDVTGYRANYFENVEVIGNIYDNPELLEIKNK